MFFWPLKKLGHEKLGSEEKRGSQVYAHINIRGIFLMLQYSKMAKPNRKDTINS